MNRKAFTLLLLPVFLGILWFAWKRSSAKGDRWLLVPGEKASYTFDYLASGRTENSGQDSLGLSKAWSGIDQAASKTQVRGQLQLFVEDTTHIRFRFEIGSVAAEPAVWKQHLQSGPFVGRLTINPYGTIESLQLPEKAAMGASWMLRDVFALMELKFPEANQKSWQSVETHPGGDLLTDWEIKIKGDPLWTLRKSYSAQQDQGVHVTGEGEWKIAGDSKLWHSLKISRNRAIGFGNQPRSNDETTLELIAGDSQVDATNWDLSSANFVDDLKAAKAQKKQQDDQYLLEIGNTPIEQILTDLDGLGDAGGEKLVTSYLKVKAFIALYPDRLSVIREGLDRYGPVDSRFGTLAAALRSVGSDAAQQLLQQALHDYASEPLRQRQLIPHLAFVENPLASSEQTLQQLADSSPEKEIRQTAELGLGTMTSIVVKKDSDRAHKLEENYRRKLTAADDDAGRQHYLRVIGNMASNSSFTTIQTYLDPKIDRTTRVTAVLALRGLSLADARSTLMRLLQTASEPEIREAAGEALQFSEGQESDLQVYERVLFKETNLNVLRSVLQATGKLALRNDQARSLLQEFNSRCGKTDICAYAASLVAGLPPR